MKLELQTWAQRLRPYFPWLSLVSGIGGGLFMDRDPERAWLVVLAAGGGWIGLLLFRLLGRLERDGNLHQRWRLVPWATRWMAQQGTQMLLFFGLPFYARAAAPVWGHGLFLGVVGAAALLTLWDPLHHHLLQRSLVGALFQGVASFAGLAVVLPMLGLPNGVSLTVAASLTGLALPLSVLLTAPPPGRVQRLLAAGCVSVVLVSLEATGALGTFVPAAPLRLRSAAMGSHVAQLELQDPTTKFTVRPPQLVCFTSIWAPHGVRDALYHVWLHNGREVDRIALQVHGGRAAGFRTWSNKQHLGPGEWQCITVTESNQVLGKSSVIISEGASG